ncbi:MAG: cytochrome c-type biogenesis protein CcmE [Planctomycetota bacterium]|jgi:cytochrome c-type biogenesis protein CcmE
MQAKYAVGSIVLLLGLIYLFVTGFKESRADHMTVSGLAQVSQSGQIDEGRRIQLGGQVVEGSIEWDEYHHRPIFKVQEGGNEMTVKYEGKALLPDTFKDGSPVVLEGHYRASDNAFVAEVVFAKCPSKYEGQSYDTHQVVNGNTTTN